MQKKSSDYLLISFHFIIIIEIFDISKTNLVVMNIEYLIHEKIQNFDGQQKIVIM